MLKPRDIVSMAVFYGGIIVVLQTLIFLAAFFLAPKHGMLAARRRMSQALDGGL